MKKSRERLERLMAFYSKEPKDSTINEYIVEDLDEVLDEMKKEETSKTVPIDDNFESMIISAFRYALGRKSYIMGLTVDYLTPLLPSLSTGTLGLLNSDIQGYDNVYVTHEYMLVGANAMPPNVEREPQDYDTFWDILKKELERRKKESENG